MESVSFATSSDLPSTKSQKVASQDTLARTTTYGSMFTTSSILCPKTLLTTQVLRATSVDASSIRILGGCPDRRHSA